MREVICRYKLKECDASCVLTWIYPLYKNCQVRNELNGKKSMQAMGYEERVELEEMKCLDKRIISNQIWIYCLERKGHDGMHYNKIAQVYWKRETNERKKTDTISI